MTKRLNIMYGMALSVLLVTGCEDPALETEVKKENLPDNPGQVARPQETITLELANEMFQAYQERYKAVTDFRNGKEDAIYGWHSIDFYKNYIAYLEQESAKVGISISGLRMYYVAYPEDSKFGEKSGYQTYMYVPTYLKDGRHIAFDPLHIGEDGVPLPIHDIIVSRKDISGRVSAMAEPSSIVNMAEMCKPNCND